jgi:hypothetical protein
MEQRGYSYSGHHTYLSISIEIYIHHCCLLYYSLYCTAYVRAEYVQETDACTYVRILGTSSSRVHVPERTSVYNILRICFHMHAWDSIVVPHIHAGRPLLLLYFLCYHFFFHTYHTIIWVWDAHPI